jgi:RNA polymerase sigma factor (sigma-70 family)
MKAEPGPGGGPAVGRIVEREGFMSDGTLELSGDAGTSLAAATDDELLRWLERANPAAFDEVTLRHRDHIYRYIAPQSLAMFVEDHTQETFLRLWEYVQQPSFLRRKYDSLVGLLEHLAWCVLCRHYDQARIERNRRQRFAVFRIEAPPPSDTEAMAKEMAARVDEAMAALPPRYRIVADLYFLQRKTRGEIAVLTGRRLRAVYDDIRRAQERLIKILGPYWKGKDHV